LHAKKEGGRIQKIVEGDEMNLTLVVQNEGKEYRQDEKISGSVTERRGDWEGD